MSQPQFFNPQHAMITITFQQSEPTGPNGYATYIVYFYESNNGGQSWSLLKPPITVQNSPGPEVQLVDATHVLLVDSRINITLYTFQQGQWQTQSPISFQGGMVQSLSFIDPQHGWMETSRGINRQSVFTLYVTSDGGLT